MNGFSEQCKAALAKLDTTSLNITQIDFKEGLNLVFNQSVLGEVQKWIESHRSMLDGWGNVLVGGALVLGAFQAILVSYLIFRRGCRKSGYTVIEVSRELEA
mmetsp:Transcript_72758/g.157916  ORF Transcript_72758/g.157916 Transcript_72758/m.157916 type:complete len:102 (+) Transcript_72758:1-306(+)